MKTRHLALVATIALSLATAATLRADVKTQERTQVRFEGALGRIVNLFGGKGAREGIVSTVALKGNRMMSTTDTTGEIVDLGEEKVYQLDLKKKTYTVVTFAELRRQMEEAMAKAKKDAEAAAERGAASEACRGGQGAHQGVRGGLLDQGDRQGAVDRRLRRQGIAGDDRRAREGQDD